MRELMDNSMIYRSIKRISFEILENNKGAENLVLVGVKTRGEFLAYRIANCIKEIEGVDITVCSLDASFWRDDSNKKVTEIPSLDIDLKDRTVILVDDVLFKGRTTRAALDGIMYYGRAKSIRLAVLIDRGHRELPIRPDFVGKNIPTSEQENVKVSLVEVDGIDGVYIQ